MADEGKLLWFFYQSRFEDVVDKSSSDFLSKSRTASRVEQLSRLDPAYSFFYRTYLSKYNKESINVLMDEWDMDRFLAHKELIEIQEAFEAEAMKEQMNAIEDKTKHGKGR